MAIKQIATDPLQRAMLWLVKNGIPFDVVDCLTSTELEAWSIIFSEFEGGEYDHDFDCWKEREQN